MIYKYLSFCSFSIAVAFISFIVGMTIGSVLRKTDFYKNELLNLDFVKSKNINKIIGISIFKWIIKNTFFKYFNQKIKLKKKIEKIDLNKLRDEMTNSEINHLIGFVFVTIFALVKFYETEYIFGMTMMTVNILMNLYPSLLQQQNKRRIDKLIKKL